MIQISETAKEKQMDNHQILQVNMGESWRSKALCKSGEVNINFFSEEKHEIKLAKGICKQCIVADQCFEFAVRNQEKYGVWGGFTPRERNKVTRAIVNLTKEEAKTLVIKYGNEVLSQTN